MSWPLTPLRSSGFRNSLSGWSDIPEVRATCSHLEWSALVGVGHAINVGDSLIFAHDSATTGTRETTNSWDGAYEIFNLRKGMPIGAMSWGLPRVGNRLISTMVKDLRMRLTGL